MNGFYKNENGELLHAPNFVIFSDGYEIFVAQKDTYTYPINDWYYFDTEEEAKSYFGLE